MSDAGQDPTRLEVALAAAQQLSDDDTKILQAALAWDVEDVATAKRLMEEPAPTGTTLMKVGAVGVDSGRIMLLDPCNEGKRTGDAAAYVDGVRSIRRGSVEIGIMAQTPGGDGVFPVIAELVDGRLNGLLLDFGDDDLERGILGAREIARGAQIHIVPADDDEREADAQEAINAVGNALDRIDAPQGATYAERIDRLYSEGRDVRRDAVDAGNEFDRISIPRSTGATGEPGTPRTLTLAERAAICIRRVLAEEEAKRLLASTVDAQAMARGAEALTSGIVAADPARSLSELCREQKASHHRLRAEDPGFREYHRGAEVAYELVLERLRRRPEEDVPPGTRELRVVVRDIAEPGAHPELLFVEIENERGASVKFETVKPPDEIGPEFRHIVIPYGRDDAWVSEVAYQAAGAATRPLLEDHPDYVFPSERVSDAVAELLSDFGIPRACRDCAGEQLEHGAKEVDGRRDATIKQLEAEVERLLGGREEARSGESRFAEERDCAFALLRWLLPVTVAKRLDS